MEYFIHFSFCKLSFYTYIFPYPVVYCSGISLVWMHYLLSVQVPWLYLSQNLSFYWCIVQWNTFANCLLFRYCLLKKSSKYKMTNCASLNTSSRHYQRCWTNTEPIPRNWQTCSPFCSILSWISTRLLATNLYVLVWLWIVFRKIILG